MKWIRHLSGLLLLSFLSCHFVSKSPFLQLDEVPLSPPVIPAENIFFKDSTSLSVLEPPAGCRIHFTTDDTPPDQNSPVLKGKLPVTTSSLLRFICLGGGYLPSDERRVELFKISDSGISMTSATPASAPYNEPPLTTLVDQQKGSKNFRDGGWLGYQSPTIVYELKLDGAMITGLALSFLEDQKSWIFAPQRLSVQFYDGDNQLIFAGEKRYAAEVETAGNSFQFLKIDTGQIRPASVVVELNNLAEIPDWHPGKGTSPWLFVDEIIIL